MGNGTAEVGIYIGVKDVFPELTADEETLLGLLTGLSRTDALFMCGRLNLIVAGPSDESHVVRQQRALAQVATQTDLARIANAARRHNDAKPVTVFFRGQLLELIRWIARYSVDLPGDGLTFNDAAARQRFFKAALIASDFWAKRCYTERFTLEHGLDAARLQNLGSLRQGIEGGAMAPDLSISLGRGWELFQQHFPRRYPDFAVEFRAATELTPEEYYVCIGQVLANFVLPYLKDARKPPFFTIRSAATTPYSEVFPRYVQIESQTADELTSSLWDEERFPGMRSLRERPMLRTADERAIILDPVFYGERATVGPLFHLLPRGHANRVFGAFGLAIEDYAGSILKWMYAGGDQLALNVSGRTPAGQELEIDGLLREGSDLVIFETKAGWLREDKVSGDPEVFLEEIRAKYGVAGGGERGADRPKGVAQLARVVDAITGGWSGPNGEFTEAITIRPVLLVHDALLGVAVYGNVLARELSKLRGTGDVVREEEKDGKRVIPLTVMTLADLEALEPSIRAFNLLELLIDYARHVPDRIQALHNFIAFSRYGKMMYRNTHLAKNALELFERCRASVFPEAPPFEDEAPVG